ncbi:DUF1727 domain-containing protein [Patescibacteria group bacterium]|nr:DUF1727 domain-containing protein [Patescibacteria group bacterium]
MLPSKLILVTGTNGKTTTTKIISHILQNNNYRVISNKSGANLLNGIISSLLLGTNILGRLNRDVAVLEVDELFFPYFLDLLGKHRTSSLDVTALLMNVSRDQLDRYFEPDIVLNKWKAGLKKFSFPTKIVLDKSQEYFKPFFVDDTLDTYGFDSSYTALDKTSLSGEFNAKNLNAALIAVELMGISEEVSISALSDFKLAYGRGEEINYAQNIYKIYLAKNPASFNNNLKMFMSQKIHIDSLLFILNDNIPDGKDVSWIYDIDPVLLKKVCHSKDIYVSGTRYLEMALRLDYAGVTLGKDNINRSIKESLKKINKCMKDKTIVCYPNYSSMLELRKLLVGRSIL